jgi:Cu-Zn family superoxide dismutase
MDYRNHLFAPVATIAASAALLAACGIPPSQPTASPTASSGVLAPARSPAVARLLTPSSQAGGHAELREVAGGVEITINVQGLKPGQHGFHVHSNGACVDGPDAATNSIVQFGAAGGHFDPGHSHNHGQPGQPAHEVHGGELPNITVAADGRGTLRYVNTQITLAAGKNSAMGRTLIIHENADDYQTDPSGNSGGRALCGLIEPSQQGPVKSRVIIDHPNAYPEGIAIDARNADVYVGSASEGHIWRIAPGAVKAEMFQRGGAIGRQAAFGMRVDGAGRLWVAGGPQGSISVLSLNGGTTVATLRSPAGNHTFLNDLVPAGEYVYVTDSFRPVLWRVNVATVGTPSLGTATPPQLEPWLDLTKTPIRYVPNEINLNGIVASPDGRWLLAVQLHTGQLWRIDTQSKAVAEVRLEGGGLKHGDGLALRGANDLYVIRNEVNEITRLQLAEGWGSARVVQRITDPKLKYPTTAVVGPRGLIVVNAQLDKMKDPPPLLPFDVVTIDWSPSAPTTH